MITTKQRRLVKMLVKVRAFYLYEHFRCVRVGAKPRFAWLLEWLLARQVVDDWHHAPACPANHWHHRALVIQRCNCGAAKHKIK
jgi:hypothetical protein